MQRVTTDTRVIKKQLRLNGFRQVTGFCYLFINQSGNVYSFIEGKYLKPNRNNNIRTQSENLNLPKLILDTFTGQPYKAGQMVYIDGNKANLAPVNLKYARLFEPSRTYEVNQTDLMSAIRCYFEVEKRYNVKNALQTRFYLQTITAQRLFFIYKKDLQHIEVFKTYIEGNNTTKTATKHGLTVRDCSVIVNQFINLLITEILQELENALLTIQPYKPKPPTKTQTIREYNKSLIERGKKPLPLRKKSIKEKLRDFQKTLDEMKNQQKQD